MTTIRYIKALQVLDSRGRPTVGVVAQLSDETIHRAKVPSGASTGKHEALELRDSDGRNVGKAIAHINDLIAPKLAGTKPNLRTTDELLRELDPTPERKNLGANATLAISLLSAITQSHCEAKSLARLFSPTGALNIPMPMVNILSGGAHAKGAMDIQDVLIIPHGATNFAEALRWITSVREAAAALGANDGHITNLIADEGGLGIPFPSSTDACAFVVKAIESVNLQPGKDISLALDIAATQFFSQGSYISRANQDTYSSHQWLTQMLELTNEHPIISIEDPFAEDDWESWIQFTANAKNIQIVGDDHFTTNGRRLQRGITEKSANSILIKPNQNGLLTDTLEVLKLAQSNSFSTVVSARSGETEDSWLADLATGWMAGQIKVGSTHGSDRNSKWNRLLELEAIEETIFANPFASYL